MIAVVVTLGLVTLGPPLLLLIGYTVEGVGPRRVRRLAGRRWCAILLSGVAISAALAAVSMAASSLTDRRAFAAIGIVLLVLASPILAAALVEGAGLSPYWWLIAISRCRSSWSSGSTASRATSPSCRRCSRRCCNIVWTSVGWPIVWWRYSKLVIAR